MSSCSRSCNCSGPTCAHGRSRLPCVGSGFRPTAQGPAASPGALSPQTGSTACAPAPLRGSGGDHRNPAGLCFSRCYRGPRATVVNLQLWFPPPQDAQLGNAGNAGRPSDRRRQRRRRQQRRRRRWRRGASTRARQQQRGDFRSTWQLLDQHRKDLHVNIATEQGDPPLLLARMGGVSGIIAGWFVGGVAAAGNGARQFVRAWRFRGRLSGKYAPRRRVRRYGVRLEGLTTSHTTSPSGTRLSKHAHRSTPSAACRLRGRASSSFVASSRSTASSSTSPPSKRRGNYLGTTLCDAKVSLEACYTKRSVPYLQKD